MNVHTFNKIINYQIITHHIKFFRTATYRSSITPEDNIYNYSNHRKVEVLEEWIITLSLVWFRQCSIFILI